MRSAEVGMRKELASSSGPRERFCGFDAELGTGGEVVSGTLMVLPLPTLAPVLSYPLAFFRISASFSATISASPGCII